jgi:hypothetical protein
MIHWIWMVVGFIAHTGITLFLFYTKHKEIIGVIEYLIHHAKQIKEYCKILINWIKNVF